MSDTLQLAIDLLSRPSVTPQDMGCQQLIAERLQAIGFHCEHLRFAEVDNLWARRGNEQPLFAFAGHTDVVPTGPLTAWQFPPFEPTIHEDMLYARGAVDMKSSIAAMVTACERFVQKHPNHQGSIAFLLTSDEEGPSVNGTVKVIEYLQARHETIKWCLVGEPTATHCLGDAVKNGRRGSLTGYLTIKGIQGHVAYPHLADNPIHRAVPLLAELCTIQWDQGNQFFPPTTFQIADIHAGTGATNIIPSTITITFNFRYSTEVTHLQLQQQVIELIQAHQLNYELTWEHSGLPFLTAEGELVAATQQAIQTVCGCTPELSTSGGTSDGRFIAPTGAQVLEFGPLNVTIHKINECISIHDLELLSQTYERILELLLLSSG